MFCSNCGKQIPDNTKFCSYCGAQQAAGNNMNSAPNQQRYSSQTTGNQQPVYTATQPQKKPPKKKKNNILVVFLVVLVMSGVGSMVGKSMAKSYVDDSKSNSIVSDNTLDTKKTELPSAEENTPTEDSTAEAEENPEYTKIFSDRFIVQIPAMFMTKERASFAKVTEEGMVESMQIGSSDDVITDMVQTIYIDVSAVSDSDKENLDATLSAKYAKCKEMGFVTSTSNMGETYYSFSCKITDLDVKDNLMAGIEEGLINVTTPGSADAVDYLSMKSTESALLSGGYIKK